MSHVVLECVACAAGDPLRLGIAVAAAPRLLLKRRGVRLRFPAWLRCPGCRAEVRPLLGPDPSRYDWYRCGRCGAAFRVV